MTAPPHIEAIALAYLDRAEGDPQRAIRLIISEALADMCERERRTNQVERLVSAGYRRKALQELRDGLSSEA